MNKIHIIIFSLFIIIVPFCFAETDDILNKYSYSEVKKITSNQDIGVSTSYKEFELMVNYRTMQEKNKLYESIILTVALLVSLSIVMRFITNNTSYSVTHLINASGLIFIVFGTIFLVLLTDSESQLTASMGIMGAVAGYLFGTMRRPDEKKVVTDTK